MTFFGREKFINREVKSVEKFAGIAFYRLNAFILRNAKINHRNNNFNVSQKTGDGENTDCDEHLSAVGIIHDDIIKNLADIIRYGIHVYLTTTAATIFSGFNNFSCKANGVYNFCL